MSFKNISNTTKVLLVLIALLVLLTVFPGVSKEKAVRVLNSAPYIARQHMDEKVLEGDVHILPVPFGAMVSTYEGFWFVSSWQD